MFGDEGHDTIYAHDGDDTLNGGAGDDFLDGGEGNNTYLFEAGWGQDTVTGAATGLIIFEAGILPSEFEIMNENEDMLMLHDSGNSILMPNLFVGGFGRPLEEVHFSNGEIWTHYHLLSRTIQGTDQDDTLLGQVVGDSLNGHAGDDNIQGMDGDDSLIGGDGQDTILGGGGSDTLHGSAGDDVLLSAEGDDHLIGDAGNDRLDGGQGNDWLEGGPGADDVMGGWGADTLAGGDGNDTLEGGDSRDASPDRIFGGDGDDMVYGRYGNDFLHGGSGDDEIFGGNGADTIIGGEGSDTLMGGENSQDRRDVIYGGTGNDSIDGGYGNDELRGDAGNDTIAGGFGADTVIGGAGNDTLTGSAFGDQIFGGAGDDFINGGFGFDLLNGGADSDRFFHRGIDDHGSDWIQDYNAAEGDVLQFGNTSATASQFQVNTTHTATAAGERSGDDTVEEAFVIYRPTGQIMWALVDGGAVVDQPPDRARCVRPARVSLFPNSLRSLSIFGGLFLCPGKPRRLPYHSQIRSHSPATSAMVRPAVDVYRAGVPRILNVSHRLALVLVGEEGREDSGVSLLCLLCVTYTYSPYLYSRQT
ncbi:calcium-binding protein [Shimia thalassica]|uniref:calcium-binding protein n=1 Tax=Shimia thalassica TaxID=1715693 RepID=UPI0027330C1D|nr:calcium-binding protein [Shimia thalassica]MDP2580467.1 calcium-binding protein [Shimia thalassica]